MTPHYIQRENLNYEILLLLSRPCATSADLAPIEDKMKQLQALNKPTALKSKALKK